MENTEKPAKTGSKKKTAALLAGGAAVGAALGVLLAPRSGKATREKVGTWIKEKRAKVKAKLSRKGLNGSGKAGEAKEYA